MLILLALFLTACTSSSADNSSDNLSSPWFNFSNDTKYSFSPDRFKIRKPFSIERYKYKYKSYDDVSVYDKTYSNN